jgi:hypothetical protein
MHHLHRPPEPAGLAVMRGHEQRDHGFEDLGSPLWITHRGH